VPVEEPGAPEPAAASPIDPAPSHRAEPPVRRAQRCRAARPAAGWTSMALEPSPT